jgi:flagellar protein FliO/FliZ
VTLFRRTAASSLPRRPMARPVESARPSGVIGSGAAALDGDHPTGATGATGAIGAAITALSTGTPLAGVVVRVDAWRVARPLVFWSVGAALAAGMALAIAGGAAGLAGQGAGQGNRSALDALVAVAPAANGAVSADAGPGSALLGGAINPIDLTVKGALVVVLLFVTLRVLRRVQGGSVPTDARIRVIESRTLGAKTQLHLVAIGARQVLIGATPGRLVTLAELSAEEVEAAGRLAPAASPRFARPGDAPVSRTFAAALGRAESGPDR